MHLRKPIPGRVYLALSEQAPDHRRVLEAVENACGALRLTVTYRAGSNDRSAVPDAVLVLLRTAQYWIFDLTNAGPDLCAEEKLVDEGVRDPEHVLLVAQRGVPLPAGVRERDVLRYATSENLRFNVRAWLAASARRSASNQAAG